MRVLTTWNLETTETEQAWLALLQSISILELKLNSDTKQNRLSLQYPCMTECVRGGSTPIRLYAKHISHHFFFKVFLLQHLGVFHYQGFCLVEDGERRTQLTIRMSLQNNCRVYT